MRCFKYISCKSKFKSIFFNKTFSFKMGHIKSLQLSQKMLKRNYSSDMEDELSIDTEYSNYQKHTYVSPITSQYNKMMVEDIRAKNFRAVVKAYKTMQDFGGEPNIFSKNLLLNAYAKLKDGEMVEKIFRELDENDETDILSYNIILGSRGLRYDPKLLRDTWSQLRTKCRPDEISYLLYLKACRLMELVNDAEQRFEEIREDPPMKCVSVMLQLYCKIKAFDKAMALIEEVNQKNIPWSISYINSMIQMYGEFGQFEDLENLISTVDTLEINPDSRFYTSIIEAYAQQGNFEYIESLLEYLKNNGMLIYKDTLHKLIYIYGKAHNWVQVQNFLDIFQIQNFKTTVATYDALMGGRLEAGHPNKALRYFQELESQGKRPSPTSYTYALKALIDTNKIDTAIKLWKKIRDNVTIGNNKMYLYAATCFLSKGDVAEARRTLVDARRCPAFYSSDIIQLVIDNFQEDLELLQSTLAYVQEFPHLAKQEQVTSLKERIGDLKKN